MLLNFFQLNDAEAAQTVASIDEFLRLMKDSDHVANVIYRVKYFRPKRPLNVIKNKTFQNVSFKSTVFCDVELRHCTFKDCLFVGCELRRCELHHCSFPGCNFHKARFVDTYVDPRCFIGIFDPKQHANIGVWVFQKLRSNALNTHQPEFFQTADWHFRRWLRHELVSKWRRKKKAFKQVWRPISLNWLYEMLVGYGHSLLRFAVTSTVLFLVMLWFNCWFWSTGATGLAMGEKVLPVDGLSRTIYYTVVTLTTLGYGDITPVTAGGMFVAATEALLGLIWFGMLTSIVVKKVFR